MNKRKDLPSLLADGPSVEEADPPLKKRVKPASGWNAVLYGFGALCSVGALMCASATQNNSRITLGTAPGNADEADPANDLASVVKTAAEKLLGTQTANAVAADLKRFVKRTGQRLLPREEESESAPGGAFAGLAATRAAAALRTQAPRLLAIAPPAAGELEQEPRPSASVLSGPVPAARSTPSKSNAPAPSQSGLSSGLPRTPSVLTAEDEAPAAAAIGTARVGANVSVYRGESKAAEPRVHDSSPTPQTPPKGKGAAARRAGAKTRSAVAPKRPRARGPEHAAADPLNFVGRLVYKTGKAFIEQGVEIKQNDLDTVFVGKVVKYVPPKRKGDDGCDYKVVYQRQQGYNKDSEWMDMNELRNVIERPKTGIVTWRGRGGPTISTGRGH